jgi:hypothetical protein
MAHQVHWHAVHLSDSLMPAAASAAFAVTGQMKTAGVQGGAAGQ